MVTLQPKRLVIARGGGDDMFLTLIQYAAESRIVDGDDVVCEPRYY
jgi:hypothetical protein